METSRHSVPCSAIWAKGAEIEWWHWSYDEEHKAYVSNDDGSVLTPTQILTLVVAKQQEGWQLCRSVV